MPLSTRTTRLSLSAVTDLPHTFYGFTILFMGGVFGGNINPPGCLLRGQEQGNGDRGTFPCLDAEFVFHVFQVSPGENVFVFQMSMEYVEYVLAFKCLQMINSNSIYTARARPLEAQAYT